MKIRKLLSYVVCLFTPTSIVDAINEAASADELDVRVLESAGLEDVRIDRLSDNRYSCR